jgi:hypothetical protein
VLLLLGKGQTAKRQFVKMMLGMAFMLPLQ